MELLQALGVAIEVERTMSLMTRKELATELDKDDETVGRYARGETAELSVLQLQAIAQALGTTMQTLLDRADVVMGRAGRRADAQAAQANSGGQNVMVAGPVHIEGDVDISAPQGDN